MRRKVLLPLAVVMVVGGLVAYSLASSATSPRADCPGKIVCPLTGEEVCADQCPQRDPQRADCPGKIACPLTGELVCRDKCPLAGTTTADGAAKPLCCR